MPSERFRTPPDNPASFKNRPPGTPRPTLVNRAVPPKKPALVVETVTFEQAVDILATHDEPTEPVAEQISADASFSACNDSPADVASVSAAITPRQKRKRIMADVAIPTTVTYYTDLDQTPTTLTLDSKPRKGMTSVVFAGGGKRGSSRWAKSMFSTAAPKVARAKMSSEDAKAARQAGRARIANLTAAERMLRIDEAAAKRKAKILADEQKKQQLVTA